jgi:hypothetical protein
MIDDLDTGLGYRLDNREIGNQFPVGGRFPQTGSRPNVGLTQPPIQCVPGARSPGVKRPGCEADNAPQPMPRLVMHRAILPFDHTPLWSGA